MAVLAVTKCGSFGWNQILLFRLQQHVYVLVVTKRGCSNCNEMWLFWLQPNLMFSLQPNVVVHIFWRLCTPHVYYNFALMEQLDVSKSRLFDLNKSRPFYCKRVLRPKANLNTSRLFLCCVFYLQTLILINSVHVYFGSVLRIHDGALLPSAILPKRCPCPPQIYSWRSSRVSRENLSEFSESVAEL